MLEISMSGINNEMVWNSDKVTIIYKMKIGLKVKKVIKNRETGIIDKNFSHLNLLSISDKVTVKYEREEDINTKKITKKVIKNRN